MAYRIATLGLVAILASNGLAQPMPDVVVTTTCTQQAQATVWVDQFGHSMDKPAGDSPPKPEPQVHAADYQPADQQEHKPVDYSNSPHRKFHHGPGSKEHSPPVEQTPAQDGTKKVDPVTPIKQGVPAPVEEAPEDEAPVDQVPKDEAPVDQVPKDEAPVDQVPKDEAPVDQVPKDEAPVVEQPKEYVPPKQPGKEAPKDDVPVKQAGKEEPKKDAPKDTAPPPTYGGGSGGSGMGAGLSIIAGSEGIGKSIVGAAGGKLGWYHNWQPGPTAGGIPDAQFCPMLHDTWGEGRDMWIGLWPEAAQGNYKCYLGQNEPDLTGEDPHTVAKDFTDIFLKDLPTGGDVTIACPSFTSDNSPNKGLKWYEAFETACSSIPGCSYNALQSHYYGYKAGDDSSAGQYAKGGAGWKGFQKFVADVKAAAKGKKVWMTEYALAPSDGSPATSFTDEERAQFIADASEHLKGEIDAYSPFTVGPGGSSQMTGAGDALASAYLKAS